MGFNSDPRSRATRFWEILLNFTSLRAGVLCALCVISKKSLLALFHILQKSRSPGVCTPVAFDRRSIKQSSLFALKGFALPPEGGQGADPIIRGRRSTSRLNSVEQRDPRF